MLRVDPPLGDVWLIMENLDTGEKKVLKTDSSGKVSTKLTAGTWRIHASKVGWLPAEVTVNIPETTVVTISLVKIPEKPIIILDIGRTYIQLDYRGYFTTTVKPFAVPDVALTLGERWEKPVVVSPNIFDVDYGREHLNFITLDYMYREVSA